LAGLGILFVKSAAAVSANYLQRVADPTSRFCADYFEYKKGRISSAQLVARLPHIAMIGDSLSRNLYVSSALSTFWRARRYYGNDWFLNAAEPASGGQLLHSPEYRSRMKITRRSWATQPVLGIGCPPDAKRVDPSPERVYSVFERLDKLTPLVATEYGGLGAMVDNGKDRQKFFRKILRTRNFSGQVTQLLLRDRFPDLILIWIGHNNVDWAWRCPPDELEHPEERLRRLSKHFREDYTRQIRRLIAQARIERHRLAIVVYGLVDFESFFKARAIAEGLRANNPKLYPYLGTDCKYFISMRPAYRCNLIRLVRMINEELHAMVSQMEREIEHVPNVQVRYSDALAKVDLSRVEVIHAIDGWHPSVEGHNVFAEAAYRALAPSLEFLGISRAAAAA
jgi:lysophospholipase L1-like esterase